MIEDKIPQSAIDAIAEHINQRNNKQYNIPIIGNSNNPETPQIFEIMPLEEIDKKTYVSMLWMEVKIVTHSTMDLLLVYIEQDMFAFNQAMT